ncbi:protein FAM13B [Lampris incognitus]|uniref:protein FAM13B n=1 Tax=Lampris incognitus TaxID=2546036 RepID=UPI0024B60C59|nr:protein FAM13B [Lampris incognitus]
MRKSVSPLPGNEGGSSATTTRVFGVSLEEVTHTHTLSGYEVPSLVKHIVDYIEEHGHLDLEGLFLVNGNAERVDWLRQRYDNGEEVELEKDADLASAVSLLRLFLQELPEPVIPTEIQGHILQLHQDYSNEEELCRNMKYLLQQLPQLNYGLLRFLCRFLASVASLQQESWNIGALAAVFGPDIFHLSTEGEDLRDQESVSRVLAELLDNHEGLFDSEDDDVSTTNDYSSINEQITELLDDEKCEAECEELPQDGEEGPVCCDSPQHTHTDDNPVPSSHLPPISILPASSSDIIERTIRAAVEQHFYELKTSINQDLSNYDSQGVGPCDSMAQGCHGDERQTDHSDSPCFADRETPLTQTEYHRANSLQDTQDVKDSGTTLQENLGMDLDTEALIEAENNINTARQDSQPCDNIEQTDLKSCDPRSCQCDQNANTSKTNRNHLSPCQPNTGNSPHLQLFPDNQWEASPPSHLHLPPIDFSCMHLQRESNDPVPAYKSWHDDSESGEAQLSPLAGRMVPLPPLPLEEEGEGEGGEDASPSSSRSHPHLLARRFLDFGAHGAQRFLQQDPDATSPTKAQRPRRASFGSKEAMRGADSVSHQLTKKLQHLKKKIKQFEEQFEKERNYKPSHGDKAANPKVLKWMTDLTKIRKQIKGRQHHLLPRSTLRHQTLLHSHRRHHPPSFPSSSSSSTCSPPHHTLTPPRHPYSGLCSRQYHLNAKHRAESELGPQTRPRSNTLPKSFGSTLDHGSHDALGEVKGQRPTREETLELIQRRVKGKRQEDGWPEDIKKMTKEQLSCEKTVLQKNLLHYEGLHGRPVTKEERLVVKPLYDRYRLVKQMLTRVSITPIIVSPSSKRRSQILQPIIEGETAHFCDEIKEEEEEEGKEGEGEERVEQREEEGESSSRGEVQSSEVIMALDPVTLTNSPTRSQPDGQSEYPISNMNQTEGPIRAKLEEGSGKLALDLRLSSSNASSMPELLEQLWKARAEKKKLRKTIREFEEDFYQHNGRNVQKEDRVPMLEEYREYKRIKAKLRLLEVLISKQDSSKSI